MTILKLQSSVETCDSGLAAQLSGGFVLKIDPLEKWLCRVAIVPNAGLDVPNTWMVAPEGEIPWRGRSRLDCSGFSCPSVSVTESGIESDFLKVKIHPDPLALQFQIKTEDSWRTVLQDRPMAAYRYLPSRALFQHAQTRPLDAMHLGLGDKTGPLDRTGRRFRCLQTDALGYNAETSDPLYKHVPWIIIGNADTGYCGVFYDTMAECVFDIGAEHSNYHDHYRTVESFEKALVYYVVFGPGLQDVVLRFQKLVGMPHFQPRWGAGFALTSMHHADADNAQQVMTEVVDQFKKRDMPISAYHSGSGYTTRDDGRRYVFTWNRNKFPDREGFFKHLEKAGLYSCANIKSVLLTEHPLYAEVASFGGFITGADGQPAIEMFWGGPGASLDFTNADTITWWQKGVKEQVLGAGFTATWNDNNECEIWDEAATLNGFGRSLTAMDVRPVQALLMNRASFEAAIELEPDHRPYVISRAGPVGISRYAQTWSGDNETSWHTLKWNLANGLSMSLSALPYVGHDIGGFVGPKPDAELLCRWIEMMVLHPRAVMNSWKPAEDNPATVPWMHASVEGLIRANLRLRYHLLPWLYHLSWQAHTCGAPVITPMLYYFDDDQCQSDISQFMVGESLLVAPVVEQGAIERSVYLPEVAGGWYRWHPLSALDSAEWFAGGNTILSAAPLGTLPLFVRAGAVIPVATQWSSSSPHDAEQITVVCFSSPIVSTVKQSLFYDDGLTWNYQHENATLLEVNVEISTNAIKLQAQHQWLNDTSTEWCYQVVGAEDRALQIDWL